MCQHYGAYHGGRVVAADTPLQGGGRTVRRGFRLTACMDCLCPNFRLETGSGWNHYPHVSEEIDDTAKPKGPKVKRGKRYE